jgi:hypothetical protein
MPLRNQMTPRVKTLAAKVHAKSIRQSLSPSLFFRDTAIHLFGETF